MRLPKVGLMAAISGTVFFLNLKWDVGDDWRAAAAAFALSLAFVATSGAYAFKAFRRTEYGVAFADAIKKGHWRDS